MTRFEHERRPEVDTAMDRYARGDDGAYAQVYEVLAPRLRGYLRSRTRETAHAEDVLQQAFLRIHQARASFLPGAEVMPWALAIVRRLLVDSIRRGRRESLTWDGELDHPISEEPGADEMLEARQLGGQLAVALLKLPTSQRLAFELVKAEGLSMAEAAQRLGTTVSAVKLRAHRAYKTLRRTLAEPVGVSVDVSRSKPVRAKRAGKNALLDAGGRHVCAARWRPAGDAAGVRC